LIKELPIGRTITDMFTWTIYVTETTFVEFKVKNAAFYHYVRRHLKQYCVDELCLLIYMPLN